MGAMDCVAVGLFTNERLGCLRAYWLEQLANGRLEQLALVMCLYKVYNIIIHVFCVFH